MAINVLYKGGNDFEVSLTGKAKSDLRVIAQNSVWNLSLTLNEIIERGLIEMECTQTKK